MQNRTRVTRTKCRDRGEQKQTKKWKRGQNKYRPVEVNRPVLTD
jgi:hypothetical protein